MPSTVNDTGTTQRVVRFGRIPLWWIVALRDAGAGIMARDVLIVIASYADKSTGLAWPSVESISEDLGVSRRAIVKAIRELEENGIIKIARRNRRKRESNLYRLFWHTSVQVNEAFTYNEGKASADVDEDDELSEHYVHLNDTF